MWPDTDAAGIVWFGVFCRYFENAEEELFRALGRDRTTLLRDLHVYMPRTSLACGFRSPAKLGDEIAVGVGVSALTDRRVDLRVRRARAGHRPADLRSLLPRRLRGRDLVRRARLSGGRPLAARAGAGRRAAGPVMAMHRGAATAASLGVPEVFNAAAHFVDRHVREGRGGTVAIECGDERVTYAQVLEGVNRVGRALARRRRAARRTRGAPAARRARVRVLLLRRDQDRRGADSDQHALEAGRLPVRPRRLPRPRPRRQRGAAGRRWRASRDPSSRRSGMIVVAGAATAGADRVARGSDGGRVARSRCRIRRAATTWPSGSIPRAAPGAPKGCVHLQHDMVVCAELFAKGVLGIRPDDRCFSVAKLFFAYGLGNALYFPFAVGATAILWPGAPTPANVYATIERHRPTLFFSVPTGYAMMLAHQPEAGARDFDLVERAAGGLGRRGAAARALPALPRSGSASTSSTASARPKCCRCSSRTARARSGPDRAARSCPATRRGSSTTNGRPVPVGEIGNLWIKGDSICAVLLEPAREDEADDRGRLDPHRRQVLAGRRRLLLVRRTHRRHAEGRRAVGEPGRSRERAGRASRRPRMRASSGARIATRSSSRWPSSCCGAGIDGTPELASELQQFVRERLADYKRPRWVEFLPELPKTATGKIQRFKLRGSAGLVGTRRTSVRRGRRMPAIRKSANASAISCDVAGPFGLNQRGIQFTAPSIANASSLGSPGANAPAPSLPRAPRACRGRTRRAADDHGLEVRRRERLEIEEERRAVQLVEDRVHEGDDEPPQLLVGGQRRSARPRRAARSSRSSEYWWQAKRISSLFLK